MTSLSSLLHALKAPCGRGGTRLAAGQAFFVALLLGATLSTSTLAQAPDPVLARVSGVEIRQSDLALAEEDIGGNIPAQTPEAKRDYLINYVADMILVAKAAEAKKVADGSDFKQRLAFARNKVLMEILLQSEAKSAV